jgi:copper homeostasis protein
MKLEVACFSVEAAEIAANAGADRIEFCSDYASGGLSPTVEDARKVKAYSATPLFIMIRPRPGNFIYTRSELSAMVKTVESMIDAGADGLVFGILDARNELNARECTYLIKIASPLSCTLHRAFDLVPDKTRTMKKAIDCGFERILTSGGPGNAVDNKPVIEKLLSAAPDHMIIMPGGGLRSGNAGVLKATGAKEFHSSCITAPDPLLPDPHEIMMLRSVLSS